MSEPRILWSEENAPDVGGFRCVHVEVSSVASRAVIRCSSAAIGSDSANSTTSSDAPPRSLDDLVRLIRDGLNRLNWTAPLLVELQPEADVLDVDPWRRQVDRWRTNQDWNRGDFILMAGCQVFDHSKLVGTDGFVEGVPRIEARLDADAWSENIEERIRGEEAELQELGHILVQEIREGVDGRHVSDWCTRAINSANEDGQAAEEQARLENASSVERSEDEVTSAQLR